MTIEQVKKELKELRYICVLRKNKAQIEDKKGLLEKYTKAIENFDLVDKTIFVERIFKNTTYLKIGSILNYSMEGIRARWRKYILKNLANMLEVKQTNFDKITADTETLAQFLYEFRGCYVHSCYKCPLIEEGECNEEGIEHWLQKECK